MGSSITRMWGMWPTIRSHTRNIKVPATPAPPASIMLTGMKFWNVSLMKYSAMYSTARTVDTPTAIHFPAFAGNSPVTNASSAPKARANAITTSNFCPAMA